MCCAGSCSASFPAESVGAVGAVGAGGRFGGSAVGGTASPVHAPQVTGQDRLTCSSPQRVANCTHVTCSVHPVVPASTGSLLCGSVWTRCSCAVLGN